MFPSRLRSASCLRVRPTTKNQRGLQLQRLLAHPRTVTITTHGPNPAFNTYTWNAPVFPVSRGDTSSSVLLFQQHHFFSTKVIVKEEEWMHQLDELVNKDDVIQAQELLDRMDEALVDGTLSIAVLNKARAKVLSAWLQSQEHCLESCSSDVGQQQPPDRVQLRLICTAAERAHNILEQMEPSLARTSTTLASTVYGDVKSRTGIELSEEEEAGRRQRKRSNPVLTGHCDAVLTAWARASRASHGVQTRITRGIPQRAQFLLERMEATSMDPESSVDSTVRVTVGSYNRVLEAWAYSGEHLRGTMAERLFANLSLGNVAGVQLNGESYRLVIWAWALSRDARAAFTATGHLMKMLRRHGKEEEATSMEPSLEDYHVVLKAWTRAEDKMSPGKAMSVIRIMDLSFEKEITQVQPDVACYRYVLLTAAQRPAVPDLGPMVDDLLTKMKERFIVPDRACYGAAIRTWKNSAMNPEFIEFRENSVKRTVELLSEMSVAHNRSTSVSVQPTTENVNDVIEALAMTIHYRKTDQAEALLQSMERVISGESQADFPKPDANSYRLVLDVWASSESSDKVARGKAILHRMLDNYDVLFSPEERKDGVVAAFNSFLRVCGSKNARGDKDGMQVLRVALAAIERMRQIDGANPNAAIYASLLECCEKLLPLGKERSGVVEKIFRLCCADGMVDDTVLRQLRTAATSDQYSRLVVSPSGDIEGTKMVPEAWTLNALGKRVVTADGRKAVPLSIDGRLTVTMAMQEFKMRRLRDKRNRNLLQGGRWPKPSAESKPIAKSTV